MDFRNTRFDPEQTRFGRLAGKMAAAFGYSADLPGDRRLLQLLRLRVAQLNPCSYRLILHTEVAIKVRIPPGGHRPPAVLAGERVLRSGARRACVL